MLDFEINLDDDVQRLAYEYLSFGIVTNQAHNRKERRAAKSVFANKVMADVKNDKQIVIKTLNFGKMLKAKKLETEFYKAYSSMLAEQENAPPGIEKEVN